MNKTGLKEVRTIKGSARSVFPKIVPYLCARPVFTPPLLYTVSTLNQHQKPAPNEHRKSLILRFSLPETKVKGAAPAREHMLPARRHAHATAGKRGREASPRGGGGGAKRRACAACGCACGGLFERASAVDLADVPAFIDAALLQHDLALKRVAKVQRANNRLRATVAALEFESRAAVDVIARLRLALLHDASEPSLSSRSSCVQSFANTPPCVEALPFDLTLPVQKVDSLTYSDLTGTPGGEELRAYLSRVARTASCKAERRVAPLQAPPRAD
ncbi:hypothetical protein DIPPA_32709 [Diplonema papillatum]|nr:hypothetical protein DIPPA_32709 [Diplonema papillatum]